MSLQPVPPSRLLGDFLRARREALRPLDLGLPQRTRRRTPGLRREEVAQLCGISPTWYTWIEQGRTAAISPATLVALAQGLHLSQPERAYLFEIAGARGSRPTRARRRGEVRNWRAWCGSSARRPMSWTGTGMRSNGIAPPHSCSAIGWGAPSRALPSAEPAALRVPATRRPETFLLDWEERARRLVAEFRADTPQMRDDPQRSALVEELSRASREFAAGWRSQRVLARDGGRRSFRVGRGGLQHFEQHILRVVRRPDLRMTVLVPVPTR